MVLTISEPGGNFTEVAVQDSRQNRLNDTHNSAHVGVGVQKFTRLGPISKERNDELIVLAISDDNTSQIVHDLQEDEHNNEARNANQERLNIAHVSLLARVRWLDALSDRINFG
mgnify:CR=1 FL=1